MPDRGASTDGLSLPEEMLISSDSRRLIASNSSKTPSLPEVWPYISVSLIIPGTLTVFPDIDVFKDWQQKSFTIPHLDIRISRLLEDNATLSRPRSPHRPRRLAAEISRRQQCLNQYKQLYLQPVKRQDMKYTEFESIISPERMRKYNVACGGNTAKAMTGSGILSSQVACFIPIKGLSQLKRKSRRHIMNWRKNISIHTLNYSRKWNLDYGNICLLMSSTGSLVEFFYEFSQTSRNPAKVLDLTTLMYLANWTISTI